MDYDVVWVWLPEGDRWNGIDVAPLPTKKARQAAALDCYRAAGKQGLVSKLGLRSIGPPEGPPRKGER